MTFPVLVEAMEGERDKALILLFDIAGGLFKKTLGKMPFCVITLSYLP